MPPKKRERRAPLSSDSVVRAALALADREGLAELSLRRLAAELHVTAMAVYRHVPDKAALLDLMLDAVLSEVDLTIRPSESWRDRLRRMGLSYHRALASHPGMARAYSDRVRLGPNGARVIEACLAVLRGAGMSPAEAANGFFALFTYIIGYHQVGVVEAPRSAESAASEADDSLAYFSALPADEIPTVMSLAPLLSGPRVAGRFEHGLDLLLSGLQARVAARRRKDR